MPLTYSTEALKSAKNSYQKLKEKVLEIKKSKNKGKSPKEYETKFLNAINNDLNMPQALAVLWDLIKDANVENKQKYKT